MSNRDRYEMTRLRQPIAASRSKNATGGETVNSQTPFPSWGDEYGNPIAPRDILRKWSGAGREPHEAEFLAKVRSDLDWTAGAIDQFAQARDRASLLEQLAAVVDRAADPQLYIAVFGEFSSGKSTLLNALLGEALLPASPTVTTSVATFIRPSHRLELRVRLEGRSNGPATGDWIDVESESFRTWYQAAGGDAPPDQIAGLLEGLLTTPSVAERLSVIELLVPHPVLGDNVVLIDTPGINSMEVRHRRLTEAAVKRSDLACVVIPASAPVSMPLTSFLMENLGDHLEKCVFVLTKGRLFEESDQIELEQWVRRRLRDIGVSDPILLVAPAGDIALRAVEAGTTSDPNVEQIAELKQELTRLTAAHRVHAVEESTRSLLGDLLTSVAKSSAAERERLNKAEMELAAVRVADLEEFLAAWQKAASETARAAVRAAGTDTAKASRAKIDSKVSARIAAASSARQFKALVADLPGLVNQTLGNWAAEAVGRRAAAGHAALAKETKRLEADFSISYGQLARLAGHATPQTGQLVSPESVLPPEFDARAAVASARTISQRLLSVEHWKVGVGAGAGALIGTTILPGIGTILGAVVGSAFGEVSAAQRQKMSASVKEALDRVQSELETSVLRTTDQIENDAVVSATSIASAFGECYGSEIAAFLADEQRRRSAIRDRITATSAVVSEAKLRHERLVDDDGGSLQRSDDHHRHG